VKRFHDLLADLKTPKLTVFMDGLRT
jgi:hypothetical protein